MGSHCGNNTRIFACDAIERGDSDYCLFDRISDKMYKGDFPRCVRHGAIISNNSINADSKNAARKVLDDRFGITRRPRGELTLDSATRLVTGARGFKAYAASLHQGYTPTIRLTNYTGRKLKAAKMLRVALNRKGIGVYPSYCVKE